MPLKKLGMVDGRYYYDWSQLEIGRIYTGVDIAGNKLVLRAAEVAPFSAHYQHKEKALLRVFDSQYGARAGAPVLLSYMDTLEPTDITDPMLDPLLVAKLETPLPPLKPIPDGYERGYRQCTCGKPYYYDYVPYSLSPPIIVFRCGCSFKNTRDISEEAFTQLCRREQNAIAPKEICAH